MKSRATITTGTIACVAVMALSTASAGADQTLVYSSAEGSVIRLYGTSTAHDWTVTGAQIDGTIAFHVAPPAGATTEQIAQALATSPKVTAQLAIPCRTLRGGNKDMDAKMFQVLKTKEHPDIDYRLSDARVVGSGDPDGTSVHLRTTGELTIAGTTRTLDMPMTVVVLDERHLKISARTSIRMSDYKVERPQALGGLLKAGDKVVVHVAWVVSSE